MWRLYQCWNAKAPPSFFSGFGAKLQHFWESLANPNVLGSEDEWYYQVRALSLIGV